MELLVGDKVRITTRDVVTGRAQFYQGDIVEVIAVRTQFRSWQVKIQGEDFCLLDEEVGDIIERIPQKLTRSELVQLSSQVQSILAL